MVRPNRGMTLADVRALARKLPGLEEGTSYGTPAFKVRGKLVVRLREDGETLVVRSDAMSRAALIRVAPDVFFLTDHYRDHPWVLVRMANLHRTQLLALLDDAWRRVAPKRMVEAFDASLEARVTRTEAPAPGRRATRGAPGDSRRRAPPE